MNGGMGTNTMLPIVRLFAYGVRGGLGSSFLMLEGVGCIPEIHSTVSLLSKNCDPVYSWKRSP